MVNVNVSTNDHHAHYIIVRTYIRSLSNKYPVPCSEHLGTSDHSIVSHELHMKRGRPFQPKIPIRMYGKSNWEDFKTYLSEFGNTFINSDHTDPNSAWNMFNNELNKLSSLHIPTKMCNSRRDLPWITPQTLRLIRKRDKMYTKFKHYNTSTTTKQFKDLKYNIQK